MARFYFSFADDDYGFRGAVIAEGRDFHQAYAEINRRGLNPGGTVASIEIDHDTKVPLSLPLFQLLSKDDLEANGGFFRLGDLPKEKRKAFETHMTQVCQACNEGNCTVH